MPLPEAALVPHQLCNCRPAPWRHTGTQGGGCCPPGRAPPTVASQCELDARAGSATAGGSSLPRQKATDSPVGRGKRPGVTLAGSGRLSARHGCL